MVTGPTGPKGPAGSAVPAKISVPLTKNKVDVPVTLPDGKIITGTVSDPKLNAVMRIFHTAWQVGGGVVCGLLAKRFGIVTSPEEVAATVAAFTAAFAAAKNILQAVKARKPVAA